MSVRRIVTPKYPNIRKMIEMRTRLELGERKQPSAAGQIVIAQKSDLVPPLVRRYEDQFPMKRPTDETPSSVNVMEVLHSAEGGLLNGAIDADIIVASAESPWRAETKSSLRLTMGAVGNYTAAEVLRRAREPLPWVIRGPIDKICKPLLEISRSQAAREVMFDIRGYAHSAFSLSVEGEPNEEIFRAFYEIINQQIGNIASWLELSMELCFQQGETQTKRAKYMLLGSSERIEEPETSQIVGASDCSVDYFVPELPELGRHVAAREAPPLFLYREEWVGLVLAEIGKERVDTAEFEGAVV